jgi:hypothetical protein
MYFEVPKAACSTMKELLHRLESLPPIQLFVGDNWETRRDMFIHARENIALPSLLDLDSQMQKEVLESDHFFRLAIVRNPYTRVISAWRNKVRLCEPGHEHLYLRIKGHLPEQTNKRLLSLPEFVDYIAHEDLSNSNPHWRKQVDHLYLKALPFSHIGKMENLSSTLARFQQHLGMSEPVPPKKNNLSFSGHVALTEPLADKIYFLYKDDFETFAYDKDSWRPHCQKPDTSSATNMIPEDRFNDEIIERNLIIAHLYRECDRLRSKLESTPTGLARRVWHRIRQRVGIGQD